MSAAETQPGGISIAWFRIGDLRLTDHKPLHHAISSGASNIIPFFCLDHLVLQPLPESLLSLPATGPYRLAAILEAVQSLKTSLNELGSDLITTTGNTAEALERLVTTATATASAPPPSLITLHYYPCLLDFDGKLGKYFEKEVIDSFLKAAAAQGIPAQVQPCTLGGGGGTSLLYLPHDIAAVHSTAGAAGSTSIANNNDDEERMLEIVVELLEKKQSMTEFRKFIQTTTPVRHPLPPPSSSSLPPLPASLTTELRTNCGFKPLERIKVEDSGAWREYYIAAGAEDALRNLEELTILGRAGGGGGSTHSGGTFSPALVYEKEISDRVVPVQRPPISEQEVQERLHRLFHHETSRERLPLDATTPSPLMTDYRESRMTAANGLETSAMLSLALSLGTVSMRALYWKTLQAMLGEGEGEVAFDSSPAGEQQEQWQWTEPTKDSPGHHWLLMHLGIRDFFSYYALKSALSLENATISTSLRSVDPSGPRNRKDLIWSTDRDLLSSWAQGSTGFPFVDASMRELVHTGWCSNRGRQNVASFLSKALTVDWRLGCELFSSLEIDHDFAVNWASWAYVAGVGADPRDRLFKTVTQGEKYDPEGDHISTWVPELAGEVPTFCHRPWEAPAENSTIVHYPAPIIDPQSQVGKGKAPPS